MANFLRLPSVRFPVLLKTFVRPKVSLPRLKPLTFEILGERYGCAPVVGRDARHLSSTSDANNGENTPRSSNNPDMVEAHVSKSRKGEQVKRDTPYRLWNPVSKQNCAILQRSSSNGKVFCNGAFLTTPDPNTIVIFKDASKDHYHMYFNENYLVVSSGEGQEITTIESFPPISPPEDSEFEEIHHGIYSMFKRKNSDNLYLGCDGNGGVTLVATKYPFSPNPQALFILNELAILN